MKLVPTYRPKTPGQGSCMGLSVEGLYNRASLGAVPSGNPGSSLDDGRLRDVLEEILGGRGLVEQAPNEGLGAPQRLQHEDLLQRTFLQVEEDRVPRRRDDVLGVPLEAHTPEVGASIARRVVDRPGDLLVAGDPLDRVRLLEPVVEALARPDVVVLEVDHRNPRVRPAD